MRMTKSKLDVEIDLNNYDAEILEWVADEFNPDDVFDTDVLEDWAEENGFVKKGYE